MTSHQKSSNNYACPMHPEVRKQTPGDCPICGMALEPVITQINQEDNPELSDYKNRFWIGFILTLPIIGLEMESHFNIAFAHEWGLFVQFILSTPVVLWAGFPFFKKAYAAARQKTLNMFSLISMGTGVAYVYSIIAFFYPHIFPPFFLRNGHIPVCFESASVIIILVLLGQILELKARQGTGKAIQALLELAPKTARLVTSNKDKDISLDSIIIGDILRVRPGEKIPIDGIITHGKTMIDESMITGEPYLVKKDEHDSVIGGTINENGSILIQATQVGSDTVLARIIQMVSTAQRSRAPIQRLADIVSNWFIPIVITTAVVAFGLWTFLAKDQGMSYGLICAINVLIIACPCALGLATPMSIMVGIGQGARNGILIKDAESLEILEKVNLILVDKTGTLTEGKPKITKISSTDNSHHSTLQLAASLEKYSEHPLAHAILTAARDNQLSLSEVVDVKIIPGQGITGTIKDEFIALGNTTLMTNLGIATDDFKKDADHTRTTGATVMFLAKNSHIHGFIAVSDPIKESTPKAIQDLKNQKIKIVILTGDNTITAKSVATQLGITDCHADVLPEDKAKILQDYKDQGFIIAMVGDGINDAPALSLADVGIAMSTGTDVAIESAGITLMKGDLNRLVSARDLSSAVMANIRQNLVLAFIYNALGVPIAAGILYPFFGILLSPVFAALAMSLSSVSVIGNALRLRLRKN